MIVRMLVAACFCLVTACGDSSTGQSPDSSQTPLGPGAPIGPIGMSYYAPGPWAVTAESDFACCDSTGHAFDIWYPSELGRGGHRHPIISWGNGSKEPPSKYDYLLRHLASWGFVVIASQQPEAGSGEEIADAANHLIAESSNPASRFFAKLDAGNVGVIGQSQGAGGSMRALINYPELIRTAILIERPAQRYCSIGDCPSTSLIAQGSVFFINGSRDVISPSTQTAPCTLGPWANEQSGACMYEKTPDAVDKLWATLEGADHNDVQGNPACPDPPGLCAIGAYGFLGYPTAWMMDRLAGDVVARVAFTHDDGEIFFDPAWSNAISNIEAAP